jgi:putative ABC transport system permease protein
MAQDLKYAWRSLTRSPIFLAIAVSTLAVGIGLNASLFSIVNVMLFRPLPVAHGRDLVWISSASTKPNGPRGNMTAPDVIDLAASKTVADATAYGYLQANVATTERAERLDGQVVMGNFFDVLGLRPHRGRLLEPADDRPAADRVAVISFALWQRTFAGRDSVVGEAIRINGRPFTIAGVVPRGFRGAAVIGDADLWVPLHASVEIVPGLKDPMSRTFWWLTSIGRLTPGSSLAAAETGLRARAAAIALTFPDSHDGFTVRVDPVRGAPPDDRGKVAPLAAMLLGVTITVLLIACANVANLLLVRAAGGGRDMAIRVALGATRWRLVREQLVESVVLAAAGGAAGLLVSLWATEAMLQLAGVRFDADFTPDGRVLLFTSGLATLTAIVFGLAPALRASGLAPAPALKGAPASGSARPRSRLQGALVAGQLALAMVLLLAAGLFLKSLVSARGVDVGFDWRGRVAMSFNLHMHGYSTERAAAFHAALLDRVRSRPGVRSASLAALVPLGGHVTVGGLTFPGDAADPDARLPSVVLNSVWPGFFETMGIPITRGRPFAERDLIGSPSSAIVNETMARLHWPGRDPIGQRFSTNGRRGPFVEVIGVARDTIIDEFSESSRPAAYLPGRASADDVSLLAWVDGDPFAALRALESDARALDNSIAVFAPKTLAQHIAERFEGERGLSRILAVTGGLAVALAAIGLYGVVAYTVARRTREIGVRVALGARPGDVRRLFVADAARLAAKGVAAGVIPSIGVTSLLSGSLVGVRVADPSTMAAVVMTLSLVVLAAAWIPARRATRVDPIVALRAD